MLIQAVILGFIALLVHAAVGDVRSYIIPNWVSITVVVLYPVYLVALKRACPDLPLPDWAWSAGIALAVFFAGACLFALGLFGGGDVKLLAAVSLWAGPALVVQLMVMTALLGGLVSLVILVQDRRSRRLQPAPVDAVTNPVGDQGDSQAKRSPVGKAAKVPYGVAIGGAGVLMSRELIVNCFG